MLITVPELISLLRSSVNVQNGEAGVVDSAFLNMTDAELELFLKLAASTNYDVESLEELPEDSYYAVLLLAKIDLYKKLAVMTAPKVDLTADNNNQIKLHQRFQHYMSLAESAKGEYDSWVDNGGSSAVTGVTSFNVTRTKNHYSRYNYNNGPVPKIKIKVRSVLNDSVEFTWGITNFTVFGCYRVYISESQIVDMYQLGNRPTDKILPGATEVRRSFNLRETQHRISGLKPETEYHIAVFGIERNLLFGYAETTFTTQEALIDGSDFSIDSI